MSSPDLSGYRVIAVHAHPDDEAIWTGGALANLARRGAHVTVVTCTLGEEGEVIGEPFQGLVADEADQLGGFRIRELQDSLAALNVNGAFLGGAGAFRDSGMMGSPAHENPRAFVNSGEHAVALLVEIFQELRPHLVITYGPDGGYGHPDHIRAHHITHAAAQQVAIPRILWAVNHLGETVAGVGNIETIPQGWSRPDEDYLRNAGVVDSDLAIDLAEPDFQAKARAMRAHATQIWFADGQSSVTNPDVALGSGPDPVFSLSNLLAQPLLRREHYQLGAGQPLSGSLLSDIDRDFVGEKQ
ncbi:N-acetyl-1-D-myo-inositol-2-amino-2-deoxy-alpha-D-glucopyranoside deacetylase [Corynebacterium alimapuense]|uniref:1D-myo-inositol 2-acetamido-2-deoxy-alpha-D-glucopyranoside deacetylase n=1 Tax=Corynebacterium alimapuense TaxID=1576874 RepID=A0A3M8K7I9_9CORY|nr:N-acetyl-1-D-myo-inositol-2-amino-2-deoxy-alpha-D-glucopyranoside deacetylase [Corynebacterium alimapuense]RNE48474.1 N-acetyl-1-D-myo-inositol-2-amino-2-deoxy-alpha-D-glucopyranoside deacetylase [Corynebacterium alimapuense]